MAGPLPTLVAATLAVVCAAPAGATTIEIAFWGVLNEVDGPPSAGGIAPGATFSGRLTYEIREPDLHYSSPPPWNQQYSLWQFSAGEAAIELEMGDPARRLGTDPLDPFVEIRVMNDWIVNPETGEPVEPDHPDAVLGDVFRLHGARNLLLDGWTYTIDLGFEEVSESERPLLFTSGDLPSPSSLLAQQIIGARVRVDGLGGVAAGNVTGAMPIPEPDTVGLLLMGLCGLAAARRSRTYRGR